MAVAGNRRDEPVEGVRPVLPGDDDTRIGLAGREHRADPAGLQQRVSPGQRQQRLAVSILILQELECASVLLQDL